MFDVLWDIHQQRRINEAQDTASDAGRNARDAQYEVRALRDALDRMTLANLAMWELIRDRLQLTNDDLVTRMEDIDLRDGVRDGRVTANGPDGTCVHCNRRLSPRHQNCMYCGKPNVKYVPFSKV